MKRTMYLKIRMKTIRSKSLQLHCKDLNNKSVFIILPFWGQFISIKNLQRMVNILLFIIKCQSPTGRAKGYTYTPGGRRTRNPVGNHQLLLQVEQVMDAFLN